MAGPSDDLPIPQRLQAITEQWDLLRAGFDDTALAAHVAELEEAMGAPGFWDDQQAAAQLRAAGAPYPNLARIIGCDRATLSRSLRGEPTARPDVAEAILALTPRTVRARVTPSPRSVVDGEPTRARLRALLGAGWTCAAIARHTGAAVGPLRAALREERAVRRETHDAVARAFDALWDAQPVYESSAELAASERARERAARAGWARAMDLDDGALGARAVVRAAT